MKTHRDEETSDEWGFFSLPTPLGRLFIQSRGGIPTRIIMPGGTTTIGPELVDPGETVHEVAETLQAYFEGRDPGSSMASYLLNNIRLTPFSLAVLKEVSRIPRGHTMSYKEVAEKVGNPRACRGVGGVMRHNPFPIVIPCHRVVNSDGSPGGYGGGAEMKVWLLNFEDAMVSKMR